MITTFRLTVSQQTSTVFSGHQTQIDRVENIVFLPEGLFWISWSGSKGTRWDRMRVMSPPTWRGTTSSTTLFHLLLYAPMASLAQSRLDASRCLRHRPSIEPALCQFPCDPDPDAVWISPVNDDGWKHLAADGIRRSGGTVKIAAHCRETCSTWGIVVSNGWANERNALLNLTRGWTLCDFFVLV